MPLTAQFRVDTPSADLTDLVREAPHGGLLATPKFLSYHGSRWPSADVVIFADGSEPLAYIPAVFDEAASGIVSHAGSTYGGLVNFGLADWELPEAWRAAQKLWRSSWEVEFAEVRTIPLPYSAGTGDTGGWALMQTGFVLSKRALGQAIDLSNYRITRNRKRRLSRLASSQMLVQNSLQDLALAYEVVAGNRQRRFGIRPTHSLADLVQIDALLPGAIEVWTCGPSSASIDAAAITFADGDRKIVQYWGTSERGEESGALDKLVSEMATTAVQEGCRVLILGASTNPDDLSLNEGLYRYKRSWGAYTYPIDTWRYNYPARG